MRVRALLLTGCLALGACNATSDTSVREREAERAQQIEALTGWDRVFGAPEEALKWSRQYGFATRDYQPTGARPAYRAAGKAITLSSTAAEMPNKATFVATGRTADALEQIVFTLKLTDPDNAATAEKRFADLIRQYLAKFDIEDDGALLDAITQETSTGGTIEGAPVTVERSDATEAMPAAITVTFTRPAATSADNSKPQG
ncbi:hypothetical protein [Stakelama saccharophila]|uniref:Lipoprotein n=1 Tax=Stakelama saccharophila TaxID=3075605 RepID=A0ABZ0B7U4_9SPHN|nr:hypothetical protein [Stakelama sp. W311]WNO53355.1 hypothetical protein RPR59_13020 [Stakelama sp. W311]